MIKETINPEFESLATNPHPNLLPAREKEQENAAITSPSPFQGEGRGEGSHPRNLKLVKRAKALRRNMTDVEKKMWNLLRSRGFEHLKFRRQYPIGKYIVDFICIERRLIIELDGSQHADGADAVRDKWIKAQGYKIIRFWNNEVTENIQGIFQNILSEASNPHPNPELISSVHEMEKQL